MERSNFEFLQELHPQLMSLSEQLENSIWENPRSALIQGRLFGELLATTISVQEKVEPVFSIKQVDRLHKLAREGLLSEEIREKFEWLRRNGNTAAHDSRQIHADTALTAHRHVFELACWYVELYGSVATELPQYQLPLKPLDPQVNPVPALPVLDAEMVEKAISDQLESRLLPSLDEKFRSLEETLLRMADARSALPMRNIEAEGPVQQIASNVQAAEVIEIAELLKQQEYELVDKRPFGGALWVIGGWELKEALSAWGGQGIRFRFARNGSNSTKRKPAWFLYGKNPSAKQWIPVVVNETLDEMGASSEMLVDQRIAPAVHSADIESPAAIPFQVAQIESAENPEHSPEIIQSGPVINEIGSEPASDTVQIPEHLREQPLQGFASERLTELSLSLGAITFGDWNEARLLQLYEQQPKLLHDVMVQLWFFGFQFEGMLGRFVKLQHVPGGERIGQLAEGVILEELLLPDVCRLLGRFGVKETRQLSGIPVSSLSWLLRGRHLDTLERIRSAEQKIILDEGEPSSPSDHRVLRLYGEELVLTEQHQTMRIADLNIQGCNALITGVQMDWNIHSLGELPEDLEILSSRIKGVGSTAVTKFFSQLKNINRLHDNITLEQRSSLPAFSESSSTAPVREEGEIHWKSQAFSVEEEEYFVPIDISHFIGIPKLITELHLNEIRTVGELPSRLSLLLGYPNIGSIAVDKFYKMLCQMLTERRIQLKEAEEWNAMNSEERITHCVRHIESVWQLWLQGEDKQRGKERDLQIMWFRWNTLKESGKVTLEETGQYFNLTRERVRQIVSKQALRLKKDTAQLEQAIRGVAQSLNGFCYFPFSPKESFIHYMIIEIMGTLGLSYLEQYGWWTERPLDEIDTAQQKMQRVMKETFKGKLISKTDLQDQIQVLSVEYNLPDSLLFLFSNSFLRYVGEEYILVSSTKADIVEMVLRKYPDGVEIYKKASRLIEEANLIWPGMYTKEREFTAVISRDEFADTAYLWGRGTYIHHSYVQADKKLLQIISSSAESLLEKRSPISIGRLYVQFEEDLKKAKVPNEYALYTLLRKYGSSQLQLRKFPHIWHEKDGFQVNNAEMLKSYIREINQPVDKEMLKKEFVERRGWKYFTVDFNLSTDPDFVRVDLRVIGLKEFYMISPDDFNTLLSRLTALMEKRPVIHINLLLEDMKEYCRSLDINSPYLLYDLLQERAGNQFKFLRFPLVTLAGEDIEEVSMQAITEQYILEQGVEVPREQVWQWLTEEVGAFETTLDNVLSYSKEIFYYTRGQFGEYIHRDNLGWDDQKEQELLNWVEYNLETAMQSGHHFILSKQLLDSEHLPVLENNLEWTEDLIIDVLKKSKKVLLVGSYDSIVVSLKNIVIKNEIDFVAHILERYFKGQAQAKELYQLLTELKYSQDGQLLYDTLTAIENNTGRIKMDGNMYLLKTNEENLH